MHSNPFTGGYNTAGLYDGFPTLLSNGRMDGWKMREGIAQLTPLARHLTPPISGWKNDSCWGGREEQIARNCRTHKRWTDGRVRMRNSAKFAVVSV